MPWRHYNDFGRTAIYPIARSSIVSVIQARTLKTLVTIYPIPQPRDQKHYIAYPSQPSLRPSTETRLSRILPEYRELDIREPDTGLPHS